MSNTYYTIEGLGDVPRLEAWPFANARFNTVIEALWELEKWATFMGDDGWDTEMPYRGVVLDPEDDRVLIWEVLSNGHKKVVWHFSGWHWNPDEFGLPQGKFLGHEHDVYSECMAYY